MHSKVVDLWYAMRSTRLDSEERASYEDEAIQHWLEQLPECLELISENLVSVQVSIADAPESVLRVLAPRSPLISLNLYSSVHIQAVASIDETQPTHPKSAGPPSENFWPILLSLHLSKSFEIACIAANLSRPGCYIFDKAHTFIDGAPISEADGTFRLQIADSLNDLEKVWPKLHQPKLVDVVKWIKKISAFNPPVATTRLQRTFAAFTYVLRHRHMESEGELLFRAMQGLEAFYCDGVGDLRKQLADKTQVWLGLTQSPSNIVGKLYDLRSKYVHGSAAMPYAVSIEDPDEHAPSTMREFYDGVELATRLLVATLQRCVTEQIQDIKWSYSISTRD
jgi:hypothetical protein